MFGFQKPQYKKFNHKPIYWDPEKEEREKREKRVKAELGLNGDDDKEYKPSIEGKFREEFARRKKEKSYGQRNYTLRLFMILTMLLIAGFYLYVKNSESILRFFGI